ncbi:MAG: hypothetical protein E2O57_04230 [Gammaproteobacteria bacterium]|nr:MAG: hypothetical protein E2O57_04230 [Gammaproteobacteria bacterium]
MKIKFSIAALIMMFSSNACASNWVELDVLVHDEDGTPIESADIRGLFITDEINNGVKRDSHRDVTNNEGMGKVAGEEEIYVDLVVSKAGYYQTTRRKVVNQEKRGLVDVLLRAKQNPIPMYAKATHILPIILDEEFGYDFQVGDYVAPHGKGVVSDLLLKIRYTEKDFWNYDYYLSLRFSNEKDGLLPFYFENANSKFRSKYNAPLSGYVGKWNYKRIARKGEKDDTNMDKRRNYFFRVRTVVDKNGDIQSAHYGKIYGEFPSIIYYFNPITNQRNIEFDPQQNLLHDLNVKEQARKP